MANGISINIGVNRVNPAYYEHWTRNLYACEADAEAMATIAREMGFAVRPLILTEDAVLDIVTNEIKLAAHHLVPGDILFISYSGHGMEIPDTNGDEAQLQSGDTYDEAWALYDGPLIDDELYGLLATFRPGVRIFVLSDSCHSGTIISNPALAIAADSKFIKNRPTTLGMVKQVPQEIANALYQRNRRYYDRLQTMYSGGDRVAIQANVLEISACDDNQVALEGDRFGIFTSSVINAWNRGAFKGTYKDFHQKINLDMASVIDPVTQRAKYLATSSRTDFGTTQSPFTI